MVRQGGTSISEEESSANKSWWSSRSGLTTLLTILLLALSLPPVLQYSFFAEPLFGTSHINYVVRVLLLALPIGAVILCAKLEARTNPSARAVIILLVILTFFCERGHYLFVDLGNYFPNLYHTNIEYQDVLQRSILQLSPEQIPHSYRFLPSGFVGFLTYLCGSFYVSEHIYRLTFNFLLLFAVYRYARIYLSVGLSLVMMAVYGLFYFLSIALYAGQLTDPMSHLSFVLAMIFIEQQEFWSFFLVVIVGLLAKESVLIMVPCWFFCARAPLARRLGQVAAMVVVGIALLSQIRLLVNFGHFQYHQVSGMSAHMVLLNVTDQNGILQLLLIVGVFVPLVFQRWRHMSHNQRVLTAILLPGLPFSSIFFSWLREGRNYIPIVTVLAVVFMQYFGEKFLTGAPVDTQTDLP